MAADGGSAGTSRALAGIAFLSGAMTMADIVAKACSSPQTTEINADKRAGTLMKWVKIGLVEGGALVLVAAFISPEVAGAFIGGALAEGLITWVQYAHAKQAGLAAAGQPGTET
jgi:formate/nitrite transporter FocA (FNT family)